MNQLQAKEQLKKFMGDHKMFTFTIKSSGKEWVAQCNEFDSIITCGVGYDAPTMERLMQDAILTAARIPREHASNLLERIWSNEVAPLSPVDENIESPIDRDMVITTGYQSIYALAK